MQKGLFITVNYGEIDMTIDLLKNLIKLPDIEKFEIAVVDNTESTDDFTKLEEFKNNCYWPLLQIFRPGQNVGYFGAADFVLKNEEYKNKDFQYVIVSNNDIEILDRKFFSKLLALNENAAVIAPDIISSLTGRHHNPHLLNPISKWQKIQYALLFSNFYIGWILYHSRTFIQFFNKNKYLKAGIEKQEIFSAYGAFMIFEKKFFQSGGIIDHGYFLYGEESSISAQCRNMKLKIMYYPELVVFHHEHAATQSHGFKRKIYKMQQNAYKYIKNHYPNFY